MRNRVFWVMAAVLMLQSCATTVKDKSAVENGSMALVRGIEMQSLKQFLTPIGATTGITIRSIDSGKDSSDKLEILLSPGTHILDLLCSYQVGGGYIKSSVGELSIEVKGGNVYQLKADLNTIQLCNVSVENLGEISTNKRQL